MPKQYRLLNGRSLLQRTIDACLRCACVDVVKCVIGADQHDAYTTGVATDPRLLPPATGGESRQASVLAGLRALREEDVETVLIHDAARPFVSSDLFERVRAAVGPGAAALPALPVVDTLVRAKGDAVAAGVSRADLFRAQTPQGFRYADILAAHEAADQDHTDDAGLARAAGLAVRLVEGERANEKITTRADFELAERAFAVPDIRVGHGYDTHRLAPGDHVTLCGVRIAHHMRLEGHSDADVGLHALTDALLATIGAGDIGDHFPPGDPQWRGVSSDRFLQHAVDLVKAAGGATTHVDVTLVCEEPKIGPHRAEMRARMAALLEVDLRRVSVKATTNEERGFVGRNEGIVALATATVVFA